MDNEKAIRAAKLTLGGILEKRRAKTAVERAQGQIAPSKYLPDVPRQVHANGGYVPSASLPIPRLAVAAPLAVGQQPGFLDVLGTLNKVAGSARTLSDLVRPEREEAAREPQAARAEAKAEGLTPEASAAMEALRKGWTGQDFGIVSGYRSPEENRAAKGAKDSQHIHGNAYDVNTTGWSPEDKLALADAAWNAGFRGFGFYDNNMHFDVAGPRAWGPSYSRDSIPDWAQGWAQERYGYNRGGPVMTEEQIIDQTPVFEDGAERLQGALDDVSRAGTIGSRLGKLTGIPIVGSLIGRNLAEQAAMSKYAEGGSVTSNDNFQSWFGNSVTHTDGEPHVFYTGTSKDKDFTSFNVGRHGAWFTRDPAVASSYADQNDSQGYKRDGWNMVKTNTASRVIPAYVKSENPYTGELPPEFMRDNYKAAQSDWFDTLRAKGHDAWIPASQGGNLLVALKEPHQIKSIYNSGGFDPKQKHMNKARGGAVEFMRGNHSLVPDELYHGSAPKTAYKGWTSEVDEEKTAKNIEAQDFREFRPSEHGNYGPGIYLSDSPKVASEFAQGIRADQTETKPHGQVMKLHVSMKQPFHDDVLRHPAWKDYIKGALTRYSISHDEDRSARDAILKALDNNTATVRDLFVRDTPRGTLVNQHGQHDIHDTIRNSGYDGIIAHRPDGSKEYVAFKPEQVKSALSARKFDPTSPDMTYADGGAVTTKTKDGSEIFGNGALIHRYTHPETGGYIDVLQRPNGPASVLGLEVPEEHRGKGIGQMLQAEAMERHPELMGQVSSKAAATTAYRLGRRPYSAPDATLDDVFSAIDRDSSVNMLSPQAQPKADGGAVPEKTVKAYKLFRTKGDGKLYPLFVNADKPVPMGEWLEAEEGPQGKAEGRVKSKIGDLAYRPGWHAGDLPMATHIGGKSDPSLKKPDYRPDNHVWAEVEMAADKDWQSVADSRGKGVKAHITDQVPYGGFYRYKTNPNMTGNWLIGGNMKVNRVLPDEEVKAINDQAGTADLPRRSEGFAAGGAAMFEGMHEDLQDEQGKPMDLWHGTPGEGFSEFKDEKLGSRDTGFFGRGHYLTPDQGSAEEYSDPNQMGEGTVMGPLHAALKNPYVWDMSDENKAYRTKKDLETMGIKRDGRLNPWDNLMSHEIDTFMKHMNQRGHDGVIVKQPNWQDGEGSRVTEVVVFKPTAIKHKDAERFDPNDPNIYHARGGVAK